MNTLPLVRIKFLGKYKPGNDGADWPMRFPGTGTRWGNCQFTFDRDCREYDWLVVYDDLPSLAGERHTLWLEELACPQENTLLITTEPSTIKVYGFGFLRQFKWVLTSQEAWAVGGHPGRIFRQPGLIWFYSLKTPRGSHDTLVHNIPLKKTADISAVCSAKQHRHTLHRRRYQFAMELKKRIPELELYGRGVRELDEKADALDPFKYHVAIENFYGPHHWTEKLSDPFLGACMPVYYGCPNAEEYFPAESFLRIDIADVDAAVEVVHQARRDHLYEKNLPAILESRRLVLDKYGAIAQIVDLVNERNNQGTATAPVGKVVMSRHRFRKKTVFHGINYVAEKTYVAARHILSPNYPYNP